MQANKSYSGALALGLMLCLSGCGHGSDGEASTVNASARMVWNSPELNVVGEKKLLLRGVGSYKEACLFPTDQLREYNDPALLFQRDGGGSDTIDAIEVTDDVGSFQQLGNSVTVDAFSMADLNSAGAKLDNFTVKQGDRWYLSKSDSKTQYEIVFEVKDYVPGNSITLRYKIISFKSL